MPKKRSIGTIVISAATFILLEVAAIAMLHSSSVLQNIWLNKAAHSVSGWIWGNSTRISSYFRLSSRNRFLEEENSLLSAELRKYRALEKEDDYLARVYDYDDGFDYIFARIVKMGTNAQRNYIIINKGADDGITTDCGIITNEGVVGVVDAVDAHHAYGRTLMNPNISVSVRLGRSGVAGPLEWNGLSSRGAVLRGIPLNYVASPRDTVWTSGYSTLFPPEIPVGIITGSSTRNGSTQDIKVELLQDFEAIEYVTVVKNRSLEEIALLEGSRKEADGR